MISKLSITRTTPSVPAKLPHRQGRITTRQKDYIAHLATLKQRRVPDTIEKWSRRFASQYIGFLLTLPTTLDRHEVMSLEHRTATDVFNATRRQRYGEYYSDGADDVPVTRRLR